MARHVDHELSISNFDVLDSALMIGMADDTEYDCPFCAIASTYPYTPPNRPPSSSPSNLTSSSVASLAQCIPSSHDPFLIRPACNLVLSAPNVMAFLDIMPMTLGHLLVTCRPHRVKAAEMEPDLAADVGFWLPLLAKTVCRVTGVEDYNIVQNNGARAAQVVPHVHFHIIPRPGHVPDLKARSWTMFGRGQREDLDDDEGNHLATRMRAILTDELSQYVDERRSKSKI